MGDSRLAVHVAHRFLWGCIVANDRGVPEPAEIRLLTRIARSIVEGFRPEAASAGQPVDEGGVVPDGGPMSAHLVTYEQAARRLAVSPRTVRRLTKDGELPTVKVGSSPRVHVRDLETFAESLRDGASEVDASCPGVATTGSAPETGRGSSLRVSGAPTSEVPS